MFDGVFWPPWSEEICALDPDQEIQFESFSPASPSPFGRMTDELAALLGRFRRGG